jgi:hypothetical protein
MLELNILLVVLGFGGLIMAAVGDKESGSAMAVIVFILLIIYAVIQKFKKPTLPNSNGYTKK